MTVALQYSLMSGSLIPSAPFFLSQDCFGNCCKSQKKKNEAVTRLLLGICVGTNWAIPVMSVPSVIHFHFRAYFDIEKFAVDSHWAVQLDEIICIPENQGINVKKEIFSPRHFIEDVLFFSEKSVPLAMLYPRAVIGNRVANKLSRFPEL